MVEENKPLKVKKRRVDDKGQRMVAYHIFKTPRKKDKT
jgi:hypothetical protein